MNELTIVIINCSKCNNMMSRASYKVREAALKSVKGLNIVEASDRLIIASAKCVMCNADKYAKK